MILGGKNAYFLRTNAFTAILTWKFKMYFYNSSDVYFLFRSLIKSICILILIVAIHG